MMKLCFMTSHGYTIPGIGLLQDLTNSQILKKNMTYVVNHGTRQEIIPAISLDLNPQHLEPLKPVCSSFSKPNHFVELDLHIMKPMLMNVHDQSVPETRVLSFSGITQKYTRQEKVMEFLLSRTEELVQRGFNMSLLSELMEIEAIKSSSSLLYLNQELERPVLDLFKDIMVDHPDLSIQSNGHNVLFSSSNSSELNDIFSIASELNLSSNSTKWRQLSPLIPHFQRFDNEVLTPVTVLAPLKSPEKRRLKPSPKKHNTKRKAKEKRDLYKRNHLHAYESLLSLMISSDHKHKTKILSLQRSSKDLLELLTQFSISVAGTGLAVLFSVVYNLVSRRVPFCANKFFDTGLGLSLVILSWAVNRLRGVIVGVNKKAKKPCSSLNDDEEEILMMRSVERSIKEVYYRAATVIAVFALRFAC